MNPANNLVLVGPMGAGKSCIGRHLAEHYGLRAVDADHELEQRGGASIASVFEREGEPGFRVRESAVLAELLQADGLVLATGGGAVLDAGNRQLLRTRGFVVHLHATPARQLQRLAHDRSRPLLAGDDRETVLHALARVRDPLYAEVADLRLDTDPLSLAEATTQLVRVLDKHWQRTPAVGHAEQIP